MRIADLNQLACYEFTGRQTMTDVAITATERDVLARYDALLRVTHVLARHQTIAELFRVLAAQLHGVVPFECLALVLHDEASDEMRLVVLRTGGPARTAGLCHASRGSRTGRVSLGNTEGRHHPRAG